MAIAIQWVSTAFTFGMSILISRHFITGTALSMILLYYQPNSSMVRCLSHISQMEPYVQGRRG